MECMIDQIDAIFKEQQAQSDLLQIQKSQAEAFHELLTKAQPRQEKRPRPSLPHPEKFTTRTRFDTWDAAIRGKLTVDGEAIGDAKAQFYYLYLNLDSHVQAMVLPRVASARTSGIYDYNSILVQLARTFGH
ncbi:hypothetical protein N7481_007245 [Penicillium waksmanii]|uniref:uncharacterized protein n=1 Tax=Penicillium waksmanii TaxID=69791 RepID=UPI002548A6AB|nr:uncharacterized protein N7481_007245 [Penicillium waksmanii]KAJ5979947.1 hypothetical protein N7481_007245 [Penicillium waksmanii]